MVTNLLNMNDPFFRTSIGFDKMFDHLERLNSASNAHEGYPPYNLIRKGEETFVIEIALAGFSKKELDVEIKENILSVKGSKEEETAKRAYVHQGLASRAFERHFTLADHVEVVDGDIVNGVLVINLERVVPDVLKPKKITLGEKTKKSVKTLLTE